MQPRPVKVRRQGPNDCGVACLAMVLGYAYAPSGCCIEVCR